MYKMPDITPARGNILYTAYVPFTSDKWKGTKLVLPRPEFVEIMGYHALAAIFIIVWSGG
jgi:hypothetical protein